MSRFTHCRRVPRSAAASARAAVLVLVTLGLVPPPGARADHTAPGATSATAAAAATAKKAPTATLFDDIGRHRFPVSTKNARAQRFIDQGMTLDYGFNHEEAIRSFAEAARLDPGCAMAWWGIALAHGPNINLPMDEPNAVSAYAAMQKAQVLAPRASAKERAYIAALSTRYAAMPGASRGALDSAYVDAMRGLARAYPDDMDAATLFAEALMNLRPWDHWSKEGTMQPGTEELLAVLEGVLARAPDHPGANHFYIHAIEASPHPERALASAQRLRTLVPAAGHLVHMPAHVYMRTGRYAEAVAANQQAATRDSLYIARTGADGIYTMMYYPHNVHFLWAALAIDGRSADAEAVARRVAAMVPDDLARAMPMVQFIPPTPYFTWVRFAGWDAMLAAPSPAADLRYVKGMWHYGRGMAFAATGRAREARSESDSLEAIAAAMDPAFTVDINSAKALLEVASEVLVARMAAAAGRADEAIAHYEKAVVREDALRYSEPPAWYQPVRQLLGAELLEAGRAADAERVYREDLVHYPENAWSLTGLGLALAAAGRTDEAKDVAGRRARSWARADVTLTSSRIQDAPHAR